MKTVQAPFILEPKATTVALIPPLHVGREHLPVTLIALVAISFATTLLLKEPRSCRLAEKLFGEKGSVIAPSLFGFGGSIVVIQTAAKITALIQDKKLQALIKWSEEENTEPMRNGIVKHVIGKYHYFLPVAIDDAPTPKYPFYVEQGGQLCYFNGNKQIKINSPDTIPQLFSNYKGVSTDKQPYGKKEFGMWQGRFLINKHSFQNVYYDRNCFVYADRVGQLWPLWGDLAIQQLINGEFEQNA